MEPSQKESHDQAIGNTIPSSSTKSENTNLIMEPSQKESHDQAIGNTIPSSSTKCLEGVKSHKEDSLWGDSDDEATGISELDREWKNRREQFYTHGYREGISAGQVDSAQEGFNNGFKDSVLAGYDWGLVRGVTSALAYLPEELRKKLVQTEDNITEFKSLHESARSISTEAAQKLFYDDKNKNNLESKIRQPGDQISASNNVLEDQFNKLQFLLQQSPEVSINLKMKVKQTPNS